MSDSMHYLQQYGDGGIIIGFSKARNPFALGSQVIRLYDRTNFSHAYIIFFSTQYNQKMVVQASHSLVHEISYENFQTNNEIIEEFEIACTVSEATHIFKFIGNILGKRYSYLQLIMIVLKPLLGRFFKSINKDNSFICSELAARIAKIAHLKITEELDYVTPRILNEYLHKQLQTNSNIVKIR